MKTCNKTLNIYDKMLFPSLNLKCCKHSRWLYTDILTCEINPVFLLKNFYIAKNVKKTCLRLHRNNDFLLIPCNFVNLCMCIYLCYIKLASQGSKLA